MKCAAFRGSFECRIGKIISGIAEQSINLSDEA
jgi:hypothetical protein